MKEVLTRSVKVCDKKCAQVNDSDSLTPFEKNCLGKCFDRYFEQYERTISKTLAALGEGKKKEADYNDDL